MLSASTPNRPLIVTLELDQQAQDRFDRERSALFPAGRTVVGAHLSLFHALPADQEPNVIAELSVVSARAPFQMQVSGLLSLGSGVAYGLESAELASLHRQLQSHFWAVLTPQDRQGFRAHVTVQNKASAEVASHTLAELRARFTPFTVTAQALRLWRYDGGPWTALRRLPFADRD